MGANTFDLDQEIIKAKKILDEKQTMEQSSSNQSDTTSSIDKSFTVLGDSQIMNSADSGPKDLVNWEENKEDDELKKSELDDSFVDL